MPCIYTAVLACSLSLVHLPRAMAEPSSSVVTGSVFKYTVQPGDYLIKIGARFGVSAKALARDNGLNYNALLMPGLEMMVDNRHIVPAERQNGLLINLPQRMLYHFKSGEVMAAYPVGLGRPDWPTPEGDFKVISKEINKTWRVPESIQEEMRRELQVVRTEVPPGPDNPLGEYWLGLSLSAIGIHGTIAPSSIYHFQSHGCIRLHPDDIADLFAQVARGDAGSIIYAPILLTQSDGRVFLEVHRDIYNKGDVPIAVLNQLAHEAMLTDAIDWALAYDALEQGEGVARDVTFLPDRQWVD